MATFLRHNTLEAVALAEVLAALRAFAVPVLTAVVANTPLAQIWEPKAGWH